MALFSSGEKDISIEKLVKVAAPLTMRFAVKI